MILATRDDYMKRVKDRIGEGTTDEDLSFIEDMTDTYDSLANSDNAQRVKALETENAQLRARYKERFFNPDAEPIDERAEEPDPEDDRTVIKTVDELFKED